MRKLAVMSFIVASLAISCSHGISGSASSSKEPSTSQEGAAGKLHFSEPAGWIVEKTSTTMRVQQYRLPRAGSDGEDASVIVYYFGERQGGSVQENIDRWIGQMQQPDGSSSKEKARTETTKIHGLRVTLLDITGTYSPSMAPDSVAHAAKPSSRMRAAVIETPKGSYFVKLVGLLDTADQWDQSFTGFIHSAEFK